MIIEHFGNNTLLPIRPVKNASFRFSKPESGGLWASPKDSRFSWKDWCLQENYNMGSLESKITLDIETNKLLVVNGLLDLEKAFRDGDASKDDDILVFDFERLSKKYDGIWLTENGLIEDKCSRVPCFYGWDCETILLFNEMPILNIIG